MVVTNRGGLDFHSMGGPFYWTIKTRGGFLRASIETTLVTMVIPPAVLTIPTINISSNNKKYNVSIQSKYSFTKQKNLKIIK